MSSLLLSLPEELQGWYARMLEPPSAGRFGQASKACAQLVRAQLIDAKAVHDAARAQQLAQAPRPRRIVFTANGKAFIDAYLDIFIAATPSVRQQLVEQILIQAATSQLDLDSVLWTTASVKTRLANSMKLRNRARLAAEG